MTSDENISGARLLQGSHLPGGCLHPSSRFFRYFVLFCSCMLTFGSYYCFDMPSTMKEELQDEYIRPWAPDQGIFGVDFFYGLYYSLYAWTNALIGALFGGIIIDRYGTHFGTVLFCSLYCSGQLIFALGSSLNGFSPQAQYSIMLVGRFVFGMGGGSITLVQNTISAAYFRHDRMAMAMGFTLAASRLGSVINLNTTGAVAKNTSIPATLWIGALMCAFGASFGGIFIVLDRRNHRYLREIGRETAAITVKKISFADIKRLPARMWCLALIISAYYIGIFAFIAVAKEFFESKWNSDKTVHDGAAFRASIVYLMSMMFTIFVGLFVDRVGNKAKIMLLTCVFSIPVFAIFQFTMWDPMFGMMLLGVTYMFAASSMWPCIPLVVPMELLGTANGIATSIQMIGIALANLLVGALQDVTPSKYPGTDVKEYTYCMVFFMIVGALASLLALVINILDARSGGALNSGKIAAPSPLRQTNGQVSSDGASMQEAPRDLRAQH